ncbi:hypothetical protein [Botrimarina mediterranea]|uniref:Uncharacterized protein n=1 Tax=Botrimarina mediterranea TaxID=2528022 RepID=A0A518K7E3_9BACT|nr:hypothetical protein [Botrimarina mediterranea]QDV73687.1 hypothetical protein Spa11_18860 [Botrimarina mediterranea]QDV78277.1 hypothetical protein K2D_18840 [Planctomycetes bacterium K2D]
MSDQAHSNQPPEPKAGAAEPAERVEPSQEELRKRYLEQQRRMRCAGCGESEEYF